MAHADHARRAPCGQRPCRGRNACPLQESMLLEVVGNQQLMPDERTLSVDTMDPRHPWPGPMGSTSAQPTQCNNLIARLRALATAFPLLASLGKQRRPSLSPSFQWSIDRDESAASSVLAVIKVVPVTCGS